MGMIMHDDVPYGEGTSYTQGTGIAINNNVIAVDADNTPTENSEKPVKSKGVYEVVEQIYADNGVLGAKNLLKNEGTSQTLSGITFTVNSDGSVTVNGTASANTSYVMKRKTPLTAGKTYIFSRGIAGDNDFQLVATAWNSGTYVKNIIEIGAGDYIEKSFTPDYDGYDDIQISIFIRSGKSLSNAVVYPMLRLASDPDDIYVPYAMTNRELTEKVNIMLPIDFSGATELTANTNLNNLGVGIAKCSNSNSSTIVNKPNGVGGAFDIITMNTWDSNYKRQIYMLRDSNGILTRICNNGSWDDWYSISMTVIP